MMARSRRKPAVAAVDFSNHEQAREWFRFHSIEVRVALAMRSALRVLPLIVIARDKSDFAPHVGLSVFRACFVAWALAAYPSQRNRLRAAGLSAGGPIHAATTHALVAVDMD